jgi:hypothetical protein
VSAIDTVERVLRWAASPEATRLPPPIGHIIGIRRLAKPPESLCAALAALSAQTAAQLHLPAAVCGDRAPIGVGGLVMAAAIGSTQMPQLARGVLGAVDYATTPCEWVARHAVLAPALRFLPPDVADDCRGLSPFTALLDRPAPGGEANAMQVLHAIVDYQAPRNTPERAALVLHFAGPVSDPGVRNWHTDILARFRTGGDLQQRFVLDVYEATMVHHLDEALTQIRAARRILCDPVAAADEDLLANSLSLAEWWGPLAALGRTHLTMLRKRRYLGYEYRQGVALFRLARRLTGGAVL